MWCLSLSEEVIYVTITILNPFECHHVLRAVTKRNTLVKQCCDFKFACLFQPFRMMRGYQQRRWMRGDDRTLPTSTCVIWRRPNGMTGGDKGKEFEEKEELNGTCWFKYNHFPLHCLHGYDSELLGITFCLLALASRLILASDHVKEFLCCMEL